MSVVTAEHFQHYIPLFLRVMRRWGDGVDSRIYIMGKMDDMTRKAIDCLADYGICKGYDCQEDIGNDWGKGCSVANTVRFLYHDDNLSKYNHVLITDIDLLLFNNPFLWHTQQIHNSGQPFAGHHGPYHKPYRPEVCPAWQGNFERVAGGFFCVTPEWYSRTAEARRQQADDLKRGHTGWWRESDEVVLARIIKAGKMPVPQNKHFPIELRGLHLGDFKESMRHRWTSLAKMQGKLFEENGLLFAAMERDPCWQDILKIMADDSVLMQILANIRIHLRERGLA